jgi:hypothetical protein
MGYMQGDNISTRARRALALLPVAAVLIAEEAAAFDPSTLPFTGTLTDLVGVIRPSTRAAVEERVSSLRHSSSATIRIVVVDTTRPTDERQFAAQVAHAWRAGDETGADDGALLLFVVDGGKAEAIVGPTLGKVLTEQALADILDKEVLPELRAGRTGEAVGRAVYSVGQRLDAVAPLPDPAIAPQSGFGPSSIWAPEKEPGINDCQPQGPNSFAPWVCLEEIMRKRGASRDAVAFAHVIGFGYMTAFEEKGKVDLAKTHSAFTMSETESWALVNGSPSVVQVGNLWSIDNALPHEANYNALRERYPKIMTWPLSPRFLGDSSRSAGGQRFVFAFPLRNGCRACETVGEAEVAFDFDASGRLLGESLLRVTSHTASR